MFASEASGKKKSDGAKTSKKTAEASSSKTAGTGKKATEKHG